MRRPSDSRCACEQLTGQWNGELLNLYTGLRFGHNGRDQMPQGQCIQVSSIETSGEQIHECMAQQ